MGKSSSQLENGAKLRVVATSMNRDVPKQARVRTDPEKGYARRYRVIQDAKAALDVGVT